jgi:DNA polymerase III delta prime subunit
MPRPKGSPNKITKDVRELMHEALEASLPDFLESMNKLKEENTHLYIQAVLKLARFIVPLPKDDEVEEANQVREITFHVVTNGNKLNEGISD